MIIDFLIYLAIGAAVSWFFFYFRRYDLFGGFWGAGVVGVIGAILAAFLLQKPLKYALDALQSGLYVSNVNIVAAVIGGVISIMLLSKINGGKKRKEY